MHGVRTLFGWSLREDVSRLLPHLVRAGFMLFMMVSISAAYADTLGGTGPGLLFFRTIATLNILLITVSGVSYFVSAVTEEKDAGTLTLLRLAGVSPLAIVLSKSTSRLISSLMLLLIQMPFTVLAITLGGVTVTQILAVYLALGAYMCLVANLALFCSVRCSTSGRAATMASLLMIGFYSLGPVLAGLQGLRSSVVPPRFTRIVAELADRRDAVSVVSRVNELLATGASPSLTAPQFWWSLTGGALLFTLSVLLFNRYAANDTVAPAVGAGRVRRFSVGRCWRLPILWKDFLFFAGGRSLLFVRTMVYTAIIVLFMVFHHLDQPSHPALLSDELAWYCVLTIFGLVIVEVLLMSCGTLFQEVRQSTIATLAMLPVSTGSILFQKSLACGIAILPGILCGTALLFVYPNCPPTWAAGTFVITVLFEVALCAHLTVLLSLYVRWAALPAAVLITAGSLICCPFFMTAILEYSISAARMNGIRQGILLGMLVNVVWAWLFILLPIELEIVNKWHRLSRDS